MDIGNGHVFVVTCRLWSLDNVNEKKITSFSKRLVIKTRKKKNNILFYSLYLRPRGIVFQANHCCYFGP